MKTEEIAILRILFKHKVPLRLLTLVEGFPDDTKYKINDAVAELQKLSLVSLIDCSSELYVSINRNMRKTVLHLIQDDLRGYSSGKFAKNWPERESISFYKRGINSNVRFDPVPAAKRNDREVLLRIPRQAVKRSAALLLFTFVFLGSITVLNSQTITMTSDTSSSNNLYSRDNAPQVIFSNSNSNGGAGATAENRGFMIAEPISTGGPNNDVSLYYIIPAGQTIVVLQQAPGVDPNTADVNSFRF